MPILEDIRDHELIGPAMRKGEHQGELRLLRKLVTDRFGLIPAWADERLCTRSVPEIEELAIKVARSSSLEDLLK